RPWRRAGSDGGFRGGRPAVGAQVDPIYEWPVFVLDSISLPAWSTEPRLRRRKSAFARRPLDFRTSVRAYSQWRESRRGRRTRRSERRDAPLLRAVADAGADPERTSPLRPWSGSRFRGFTSAAVRRIAGRAGAPGTSCEARFGRRWRPPDVFGHPSVVEGLQRPNEATTNLAETKLVLISGKRSAGRKANDGARS
ncbi:MAG: hypothetical protein QOD48_192, partial [Gaiellaceae bacterium]|nr:hypothetical protein [Gaiellaceae bacterium]